MIYDYLQNCKAIEFEKIIQNINNLRFQVTFMYIFWLSFDKANHSFPYPFLLLG